MISYHFKDDVVQNHLKGALKKEIRQRGAGGIKTQCLTFCQAQASLIHFSIPMQMQLQNCLIGEFQLSFLNQLQYMHFKYKICSYGFPEYWVFNVVYSVAF